jgi:FkbM family methyltransferase
MSYKENTSTIKQDVLGKKSWLYCNSGKDGEWDSLVENVEKTKEKYLQYVEGRDVVITAGGHIGMYVRFFAQHFKRVYAFEPDPIHFHCMVNNNQLDNVVKIQAALGDEHRLVNVGFGRPGTRQSYKVQDERILEGNFEAKTEPYIPLLKIDDLNLPCCDLIQLDIEDYEYYAIRGAVETLRRHKPVVILENGQQEKTASIMRELNYQLVDVVQADSVFKYSGSQWQVVFR